MLQNVKSIDITYGNTDEPPKQPEVKKKFLGLKRFFFIFTALIFTCILGLSSGIIIYRFFAYYKNTQTITEIKNVEDFTKSREDIEAEKLNQISKNKVEISKLTVLANDSDTQDLAKKLNISSELKPTQQIVVTETGSFTIPDSVLKNISLVYAPATTNTSLDLEKFITSVSTLISKNSLDSVQLSASFIPVTNYNEIISQINELTKPKEIKLLVELPPKWGDFVDYTDYIIFDPSYDIDIPLNTISIYADIIVIKGFGYTTSNSILPGPISPNEWLEKVIQYHISKGIERSKIQIEINTKAYVWEDREVSLTNTENYILATKQTTDLKVKTEFDKITPFETFDGENFVNKDKFVIVLPTDQKILDQIELVADYGLSGIILK